MCEASAGWPTFDASGVVWHQHLYGRPFELHTLLHLSPWQPVPLKYWPLPLVWQLGIAQHKVTETRMVTKAIDGAC